MTESLTIAPLKNVALFNELIDSVMSRPDHLPGLGVFYGPAGYGKSFSAQYAMNLHQAYYLEVGAFWTPSTFCDKLLQETGGNIKGTVTNKIDQILERLSISERPLIIDEFDHLDTEKKIELVRYIHDQARTPIILIGEEHLPTKLEKYERFHSRIMNWVGAEKCTLQDTVHLAKLYCRGVEISEEVLKDLNIKSGSTARRICTNLEQISRIAKRDGLAEFNVDNIDFRWFEGRAPKGRRL